MPCIGACCGAGGGWGWGSARPRRRGEGGQGLTIGPLVRRLGLTRRVEEQGEYERRHARAMSARAAHAHLARLHRDGLLSSATWERLEPALGERSRVLADAVKEVLRDAPAIQAE